MNYDSMGLFMYFYYKKLAKREREEQREQARIDQQERLIEDCRRAANQKLAA